MLLAACSTRELVPDAEAAGPWPRDRQPLRWPIPPNARHGLSGIQRQILAQDGALVKRGMSSSRLTRVLSRLPMRPVARHRRGHRPSERFQDCSRPGRDGDLAGVSAEPQCGPLGIARQCVGRP